MRSDKFIVLLFVMLGNCVFAQRQTTSPFSRFGYGDLYGNASVHSQAMGGIGVGVCNPVQINFQNPAVQARVQGETFMFDAIAGGNFRHVKEGGASANLSSVGFESFSLAFPIIADRWGCAVGMLPFNSVGYTMNYKDSECEYTYKGNGGVNQFALSTGVRLFKGLSVGANVAYLFGTTNYTGEAVFEDDNVFNSRKDLELKTQGFLWLAGIQYNWQIQEEKALTIGVTGRGKQTCKYKSEEGLGTYIISSFTEYPKDTAIFRTDRSETDIPLEVAFGISYAHTNKYMVGIDAGFQSWKDVVVYGTATEALESTKYVELGGELIPDYRSSKFYKRIPIRMGVHFAELPIMFEHAGESAQAREWGVSLGTRIKSKQTQNALAIALDFGSRGNKSLAESLQETYMLAKLSVSLQETWFKKRKIN